jgi:phosphoribosylamine--glycine ligase
LTELGENNYVIKANGLKSGKGVKVAGDHLHSFEEALTFCREIHAESQAWVIEEKLVGQEFSLMCFCDGDKIIPMPIVQDHKRAFVDDQGPNTGGMGSYSDMNHSLPFLTEQDIESARHINETIMQALFSELREKYIGILYGGFMATPAGVQVIEFNARFGDPEALNVLSILESDFVTICQSMVMGHLSTEQVQFAKRATVCKYAVPEGYPDNPIKDAVIDISAVKNKSQLYLASVHAVDGKIVTTHSRTAAYVGIADTIFAAEKLAEKEISGIDGPLFHREDIGTPHSLERRISAMRRLRTL